MVFARLKRWLLRRTKTNKDSRADEAAQVESHSHRPLPTLECQLGSATCLLSDFAPEPSLARLPPEILLQIVPDPFKLHGVSVDDDSVTTQGWLAIKHDWRRVEHDYGYGYHRTYGPQHSITILWALSHTSRRLRAIALPLLWSIVHIETVSELGRLTNLLREAPHLVPFIRHFAFFYDINGDYDKLEHYPGNHGSLLDMAFIDRGALWERTRRKLGSPEIQLEDRVFSPRMAYFTHRYRRFFEPGHEPLPEGVHVEEKELKSLSHQRCKELLDAERERREVVGPYRGPNPDRAGPDGKGEDPRIQKVKHFHSCLGEVTAALTSLEVFVWSSPCAAMPLSVHDALKRARNLKKLRLHSPSVERRGESIVPYWELSPQLESLWLETAPRSRGGNVFPDGKRRLLAVTDEVGEAEVTALQVPSAFLRVEMQFSILHRTIVAAAKGGRLKRLILPERCIQKPFAVRALLPYWINIEQWHVKDSYSGFDSWPKRYERWSTAAASLRPALAHASVWIGERTPDACGNRLLTRDDVQALHVFFRDQAPLDFTGELQSLTAHDPTVVERYAKDSTLFKWVEDARIARRSLVDLYLPWLAEDAELAQQVADAWNRLVEAGKADVVECICEKCNAERGCVIKCHCESCRSRRNLRKRGWRGSVCSA